MRILTIHEAEALLNAVFWYACKSFGLRGADKHCNRVREQYSVNIDTVGRHLRFLGRSSKNVQWGIKQRQVKTKDLKIYAQPRLEERCVVDVFTSYMAAIRATGPFYPCPIKGSFDLPCFSLQVVGKNTLKTMVKCFCARAGFSENFTNH